MFKFRQFSVDDSMTAMKVGTDGVLIGAWAAGGKRILDVGTGSGLIALMMAQRFPDAMVTGIDIDNDACMQAKENVSASTFTNRIDIVNSSLQDYAKAEEEGNFDAIVSNPPYFQNSLKSPDSRKNVARHTDSLPFRDLLKCSKGLLKEGGTLSIIGPIEAKEEIESEAIIIGMTIRNTCFIKSKVNKKASRFMSVFVNGIADSFEEDCVSLIDDDNKRTKWYRELTKDFYIK